MDSATPSPNLWVGLKYCLIDRNRIGFSSSCKQQRLASWLPSWTFDSAYSSSAWCKNGLCHCLLALHQYLSTYLSVWHTPCSASLMICWFLSRACVSGLHSSPLLVHVPIHPPLRETFAWRIQSGLWPHRQIRRLFLQPSTKTTLDCVYLYVWERTG